MSSLIAVKAASASTTMPKPSVPEFTVKFIDASYYTPTTYSIDPYTGRNVTHPSYYVANKTIIVSIKNQPFVSTYDSSGGWNSSLFYNIRIKGHHAENWTNLYLVEDLSAKSNSEYTVFSYVSEQPNCENTYILGDIAADFPVGAQVDFQVEAMNGYVHRVWSGNATNQLEMLPYVFSGEESGWSDTQTVTINTNDATALYTGSPSPTSTPDQTPEPTTNTTSQTLQLAAIMGAVIAVVLVYAGLLVYFKKRNRQEGRHG
jgi:hypothetical protein